MPRDAELSSSGGLGELRVSGRARRVDAGHMTGRGGKVTLEHHKVEGESTPETRTKGAASGFFCKRNSQSDWESLQRATARLL